MDWETLVFIFIFFILPVIQQVLRGRRGEGQPPAEEPGDTWWSEEERPVESRPAHIELPRQVEAETGGSWSEGWGSWPDEPVEVRSESTRSVETEVEEPETGWWRRAELEVEEEPAFSGPVLSEPPMRPAPPIVLPRHPPMRAVPQEAQRVRIAMPSPSLPPAPKRTAGRRDIGRALRHRNALREAIILREVLGPPLALRESDQPGDGPI